RAQRRSAGQAAPPEIRRWPYGCNGETRPPRVAQCVQPVAGIGRRHRDGFVRHPDAGRDRPGPRQPPGRRRPQRPPGEAPATAARATEPQAAPAGPQPVGPACCHPGLMRGCAPGAPTLFQRKLSPMNLTWLADFVWDYKVWIFWSLAALIFVLSHLLD